MMRSNERALMVMIALIVIVFVGLMFAASWMDDECESRGGSFSPLILECLRKDAVIW